MVLSYFLHWSDRLALTSINLVTMQWWRIQVLGCGLLASVFTSVVVIAFKHAKWKSIEFEYFIKSLIIERNNNHASKSIPFETHVVQLQLLNATRYRIWTWDLNQNNNLWVSSPSINRSMFVYKKYSQFHIWSIISWNAVRWLQFEILQTKTTWYEWFQALT